MTASLSITTDKRNDVYIPRNESPSALIVIDGSDCYQSPTIFINTFEEPADSIKRLEKSLIEIRTKFNEPAVFSGTIDELIEKLSRPILVTEVICGIPFNHICYGIEAAKAKFNECMTENANGEGMEEEELEQVFQERKYVLDDDYSIYVQI